MKIQQQQQRCSSAGRQAHAYWKILRLLTFSEAEECWLNWELLMAGVPGQLWQMAASRHKLYADPLELESDCKHTKTPILKLFFTPFQPSFSWIQVANYVFCVMIAQPVWILGQGSNPSPVNSWFLGRQKCVNQWDFLLALLYSAYIFSEWYADIHKYFSNFSHYFWSS